MERLARLLSQWGREPQFCRWPFGNPQMAQSNYQARCTSRRRRLAFRRALHPVGRLQLVDVSNQRGRKLIQVSKPERFRWVIESAYSDPLPNKGQQLSGG